MEWNSKNIKITAGILGGAIFFYWCLENLTMVSGFLGTILGLLMPFLVGLCIAFFINVPMRAIENILFEPRKKVKSTRPPSNVKKIKTTKNKKIDSQSTTSIQPALLSGKFQKIRRPFSMLIALIFVIAVILAVMLIVIPEIGRTAATVRGMFPSFLKRMEELSTQIMNMLPEISTFLEFVELPEINWENLLGSVGGFLKAGASNILGSTINIANSVFNGVFNFALGLVFAIYVLLQKEKLSIQAKKMSFAYLKEENAERVISVFRLANKTFSNFLTGQCLEAVILGLMFFAAMGIFQFPYAMMISVLIGFTALIPVFGAFLGCFVGALLILVVNPMQSVWFLLLFLVLQQVEGNLIYPRVVGSSVGLPGMWVLVAVTIGGSALGVTGMLVMVPLCSVVYALIRESVNKRLTLNGIPVPKWKDVPKN